MNGRPAAAATIRPRLLEHRRRRRPAAPAGRGCPGGTASPPAAAGGPPSPSARRCRAPAPPPARPRRSARRPAPMPRGKAISGTSGCRSAQRLRDRPRRRDAPALAAPPRAARRPSCRRAAPPRRRPRPGPGGGRSPTGSGGRQVGEQRRVAPRQAAGGRELARAAAPRPCRQASVQGAPAKPISVTSGGSRSVSSPHGLVDRREVGALALLAQPLEVAALARAARASGPRRPRTRPRRPGRPGRPGCRRTGSRRRSRSGGSAAA